MRPDGAEGRAWTVGSEVTRRAMASRISTLRRIHYTVERAWSSVVIRRARARAAHLPSRRMSSNRPPGRGKRFLRSLGVYVLIIVITLAVLDAVMMLLNVFPPHYTPG